MFGERKEDIRVSKNASLRIPDTRVCKYCDHFTPTSGLLYEDAVSAYEMTCENSNICRYIFNQLEALLDEHLDDEFHGIFKEGLNSKLEEEKEEEHGQTI